MSHPKILYVGVEAGTSLSRLNALREMEPNVEVFDTTPFKIPRKLSPVTFFEDFTRHGYFTYRINRKVLQAVRRIKPDIVWIDAGNWVMPSTLKAMRREGAFLAMHYTDALWPSQLRPYMMRRFARKTATMYDIMITSNMNDHKRLDAMGKGHIELTRLGYDDDRFNNSPLTEEELKAWGNNIIFIGHCEDNTEKGLRALLDAGLPVKVYGGSWKRTELYRDYPEAVKGRVSDEDYVTAYKAAKIGLCFVSKINYNQTSARSFEIPACGTFMLAMRSQRHADAYIEGKEAEFFGDHDELIQKARYYLEHAEKREEIARQGHLRCVNSGYSWRALMQNDWRKTRQLFDKFAAGG